MFAQVSQGAAFIAFAGDLNGIVRPEHRTRRLAYERKNGAGDPSWDPEELTDRG